MGSLPPQLQRGGYNFTIPRKDHRLCPELKAQVTGLAGAHLVQSWVGLVSAPALQPSACCLPCQSLSSVSASVERVWQTQGVTAQQTRPPPMGG